MSLRARLLLGMALVAVVLIGVAVTITRATEGNLVQQVDNQLDRSEGQLSGGFDRDGRGNGPSGDTTDGPSSFYAAELDVATGTLRTVSEPDTTESDPGSPKLTVDSATAQAGLGPFTVSSTNSGLRYRAVVTSDDNGSVLNIYALPLEDVDDTMARLVKVEALASIALLAALGLVTFWVLHLGVRPLRRMTAAATAIGQGDLSQRVPESQPGTEAGDLGVALNHMLANIEEAFATRGRAQDRLRQFVADASHELRTPVATIRGYAELHRLGGLTDDHQVSEAMRRTEQEAIRMGTLVNDLLTLARLDQGRSLHLEPVDLGTLASDAVCDARAVEPSRRIDLDVTGSTSVLGDEHQLRQVLSNLLGNARVHTSPSDPVHVRVRGAADQVSLEIADEGPGMSEEAAARAFERFYRADAARTRHTGGSGLGLSIVHDAVAAHHGTAALTSTPGNGTTVAVTFPARQT
ncbi:MAG: histidine kinase [Ilumatobacteraceae bacterium]|nr:histidine kinase [Ilumatobacteraceae bacterium]